MSKEDALDKTRYRRFVAKTESLVKPQDVTAISFLGDLNRLFPAKVQDWNMRKGSSQIPYMGFIVDPYCFFLAYEIKDRAAAQALLPPAYELADTSVFQGQAARPLMIIGAFAVRTSAFIGNRLEFYLIARHKHSGQMSWIIAEYETNTNSYDPKQRFGGYTADPATLTTTPFGELLVDFGGKRSGKAFQLSAQLGQASWAELTPELWIEGNLSVDYGAGLQVEGSEPFSLIFDPFLMARAQLLPLEALEIRANDYLPGIIDPARPICAAVFPYSQHFIIRQEQGAQTIRDEAALEEQLAAFLARSGFKTMVGDDIKRPLLRGMLVSALVSYGLIIFLALRWILS